MLFLPNSEQQSVVGSRPSYSPAPQRLVLSVAVSLVLSKQTMRLRPWEDDSPPDSWHSERCRAGDRRMEFYSDVGV